MPFPLSQAPEKIYEKLDRGLLPGEDAVKLCARFGSGRSCDGCDQPILRGQVEYDFDAGKGRIIRMHVGCAGLWEAERRRRQLILSRSPLLSPFTERLRDAV